jgi:surface-anchored protein
VLPETQNLDLLFLGIGAEELEPGVFVGDEVELALTTVSGPGDLFLWTNDSFGDPQDIFFDSSDGINATDAVEVGAGDHMHANWAFTAPGTYQMGFEASGTLVDGDVFTASGEVIYTFEVQPNPPPATPPSVGGVGLLPEQSPGPGAGPGSDLWVYAVAGAAIAGITTASLVILLGRRRGAEAR